MVGGLGGDLRAYVSRVVAWSTDIHTYIQLCLSTVCTPDQLRTSCARSIGQSHWRYAFTSPPWIYSRSKFPRNAIENCSLFLKKNSAQNTNSSWASDCFRVVPSVFKSRTLFFQSPTFTKSDFEATNTNVVNACLECFPGFMHFLVINRNSGKQMITNVLCRFISFGWFTVF